MLTLSEVGRRHGARVLFAGVSLQVPTGRRVALVGPNGSGKTTLLELLAGLQEPDEGTVARSKGLRVGYLPQDVAESAGRSVLEEALGGADDLTALERRLRDLEAAIAEAAPEEQEALVAEYGHVQDRFQHLGGYSLEAEARQVLAGLGFAERDFTRDIGELSGGWMMRVALARLLLARSDVLLLDEPTNHLDLDSVRWLEGFLTAYPGALVLVSHDRDFIDALAERVVELASGRATEYVGGYSAYVEQRQLRREQLEAAARNQQRKIAETERFIERFRAKNTIATRVQSRIKALEKIERIELPDDKARAMRLRFPPPARPGRDVVVLDGVVKRYGELTVYDGLDLVIERGQKVALVGPNGAGKSTLLKLLAGVLAADAGERRLGHNVTVAYYAQHLLDALDPDKTVLEELSGVVDTAAVNPRSVAGAFLFPGDDVDKPVRVLSGGERARLALAKLVSAPVNLLCMDEPTNHLDIAAREVVEEALAAYPGVVVLITHDRRLMRTVANTVAEVGGGQVRLHPGSWDDYAARATQRDYQQQQQPSGGRDRDGRKRAEADRRNRLYAATKDLRAELERVEAELMAAEAEVAELNRAMADPGVYDDGEVVRELAIRHGLAKDRAAALGGRWEELVAALERIEAEHSADRR